MTREKRRHSNQMLTVWTWTESNSFHDHVVVSITILHRLSTFFKQYQSLSTLCILYKCHCLLELLFSMTKRLFYLTNIFRRFIRHRQCNGCDHKCACTWPKRQGAYKESVKWMRLTCWLRSGFSHLMYIDSFSFTWFLGTYADVSPLSASLPLLPENSLAWKVIEPVGPNCSLGLGIVKLLLESRYSTVAIISTKQIHNQLQFGRSV